MGVKRASLGQTVRPSRKARIERTPLGNDERVSWRIGDADMGGPFAWSTLTEPELVRLVAVLREVDKKQWGEVMGNGTGQMKLIPCANLCSEAQRRLIQIKRDDESSLIEIRLGGKPRVWGIRYAHNFHILWWDPDHEVCPSRLRGT